MPILSTPKTILSNHYRYGKIIPTGLIVHYDIQNTSSYSGSGSTITDLTRYDNSGSLVGAYTFDISQNVRSLLFNGTTAAPEYVVTANIKDNLFPSSTSTNISVFLWVYPLGNGGILSEQGNIPPDSGWYDNQIELINGSMNFAVWPYAIGSPTPIVSSIATPLNQWHYVGFTYDQAVNRLTAYVNGASAGTLTITRQSPNTATYYYTVGYSSSTDLIAGTRQQGNFRFGALHIYNYPLTLREVQYNYYSSGLTSRFRWVEFDYPNFASTDGLTLVSTVGVVNNALYLTDTTVGEVGNVYLSRTMSFNRNFSFEWNFDCSGGTNPPADGFCLQWTPTNNTSGAAGGSVGYINTAKHALLFKTYINDNLTWYNNNVLQSTLSGQNFERNLYFWIDYSYSLSTLTMYWTTSSVKPSTPNTTLTGFLFDATAYYIGFGAATGGSTANHILRSMKLTFT
jgi:hypothetical protein